MCTFQKFLYKHQINIYEKKTKRTILGYSIETGNLLSMSKNRHENPKNVINHIKMSIEDI